MFSDFGTIGSRLGGPAGFFARLRNRRRAPTTVFSGLDHLFIIQAIILRDLITRNQKAGRIGFLVEFIMPTMVILLHYYVFLTLQRYMASQIPVALFVLGGFPVWFTVRNTASKVTRRGEGGLGVIFLPGISQMHFLIAVAVWECAAMMTMMYAGLIVVALLGGDVPFPNIIASVPIFIIAAMIGTGARLVFESVSNIWPLFKGIKKVLMFMIFLTSGIYYSGKTTSQDLLTELSWYNPLIHLLDNQRRALWPGYPISQVTMVYPIEWAFGALIVGLLMNRWLKPWVHR